MPKWTNDDLRRQFNAARAAGWLAFFTASAERHGFTTELLLGIGSRETNLENIRGDFQGGIYHGYGVMQVDIKTDPQFCNSGAWRNVEQAIERGAQILAGKRDYLARRAITDLQAVCAAYNTGEGNVAHSITLNRDPDTTTTGHDYGADVLARAEVFRALLQEQA